MNEEQLVAMFEQYCIEKGYQNPGINMFIFSHNDMINFATEVSTAEYTTWKGMHDAVVKKTKNRVSELYDELREKNDKIDKLLNEIGQLEYNK